MLLVALIIIELYYKGLKNAGLLIELHAFISPNLPLFAAGLAPPPDLRPCRLPSERVPSVCEEADVCLAAASAAL